MEREQKSAEKILSEKELTPKSVGFIEHILLCSDTFLYLIGETTS
jgi:hypothetical protein